MIKSYSHFLQIQIKIFKMYFIPAGPITYCSPRRHQNDLYLIYAVNMSVICYWLINRFSLSSIEYETAYIPWPWVQIVTAGEPAPPTRTKFRPNLKYLNLATCQHLQVIVLTYDMRHPVRYEKEKRSNLSVKHVALLHQRTWSLLGLLWIESWGSL